MSRIKRTSKGLVLMVALAAVLCGSARRRNAVVLANQASETSTIFTKLEQIAQSNQGYAEAQRRIQVALKTQAVVLNLVGLSLTQLPPKIGQLTNLKVLSLNSNELSSLPAEIEQLKNLQWLTLDNNELSSLPAEIGQLKNLGVLYLENNQLSSLPAEIEQLTNLQQLNLNSNKLNSLPAEIGQLTNLLWLSLNSNELSSLPAEIRQLTNLQGLDLDNNELSSLPAEIGQLTNLKVLSLENNSGTTGKNPTVSLSITPPPYTVKRFVPYDYPQAACKDRLEGKAEYRIWVNSQAKPIVQELVISTRSSILDRTVKVAARKYQIKAEDTNRMVVLPFDIKYSQKVCEAEESTSP